MQNTHKKLTACAVAAILGLSCMVYPVHAEETESGGQTDTGELLEADETAVPLEEKAEPEATPTPEAGEPEPVIQEQAETEADKEETTSETVETEQETQLEATGQTNEEAEPQKQIQNSITPYANNTGDFTVTGGTYGTDYTYDGDLHILTTTKLTITTNGKPTSSKIKGDTYGETYNLVFNNLSIKNADNANHVEILGNLNLTIIGTNKIDVGGVGLTSSNLTITSDSTGSLDIKGTDTQPLWISGHPNGNAFLKVNGGSLTYNNTVPPCTDIITSGTGTINGQTYPEKTPAPTPTFTTTQTASSITVNLANYQSDYGQVQYKWDNGDWGTSNTLSNLGANASHIVLVRYMGQGKYTQSDEQKQDVKTKSADYTISIPAVTLEAGKEDDKASIAVDSTKTFDLGYNGHVDVTIKNDNNVTTDAELKLKRTTGTQEEITSALLVNGTALGNINNSVATFKTKTDTPVTVSFAKPTETDIPAGTYSGTITFVISYSEQ